MGLIIPIAVFLAIIVSGIGVAEALNPVAKHSVGITLSNTCIAMIKSGLESQCPTYAELSTLDSSDHKVSGGFGYGDNGFFHRYEPNLQNSWRFYDYDGKDSFRIFVDPPKGMHDKIKMIYIEANFDTYKLTKDHAIDNYTRILYHDRYMDDRCRYAQINAKDWKQLLPDTIFVIREGCDPSKSKYSNIEYVPIKKAEHDISTSYKWKHDKWVEQAKECAKVRGCTMEQPVG